MLALQERKSAVSYDERHDVLGYRFCIGKGPQGAAVALLARPDRQHADPEDLRDLLAPWLSAVTGHHGRPPALVYAARPLSDNFPVAVSADARRRLPCFDSARTLMCTCGLAWWSWSTITYL